LRKGRGGSKKSTNQSLDPYWMILEMQFLNTEFLLFPLSPLL
jgi:hypothetical protein